MRAYRDLTTALLLIAVGALCLRAMAGSKPYHPSVSAASINDFSICGARLGMKRVVFEKEHPGIDGWKNQRDYPSGVSVSYDHRQRADFICGDKLEWNGRTILLSRMSIQHAIAVLGRPDEVVDVYPTTCGSFKVEPQQGVLVSLDVPQKPFVFGPLVDGWC